MANISWPAGLPATLILAGLKARYADPVIRTDMDMGPQKTRLRYTRPPKNYSGVITTDGAGRKALEYFYRITTRYGALRFNFPNPQTLEVREFRFREPPDEASAGDGAWNISLQLEEL
ncbi:MAG: hypothetical protein LBL20_02965 [Treponema sp.]|jgi:hypothetical protein|nr:hypothetical protein [Treponema sp.]